MSCDRYEVLHKVVRIANCLAFDYPRCVKSILRYLLSALKLEEASFHRLDPRRNIFSHSIQASGTDLFLPCHRKPHKASEATALRGHQPIQAENLLHLPVFNRRHNYGVLSLRIAAGVSLPAQWQDLLNSVCDQMASLTQHGMVSGEERRRVAQLTLLSELGRELNRAQTLNELIQVALRTLKRHVDAACVVLRPIYGETLLDRCRIRVARPWCELRSTFLGLEEELSTQVLAGGKPLFRRKPTGASNHSTAFPPAIASIPLPFQTQILGTLTLFGEEDGKGIPLVSGPEAKKLFAAVGSQIANALERVTSRERLTALSAENERKLKETTLLYRTSRAMHSTLRLNELMHLILSAAALPEGGAFERAMLFMVNERSGILQGMLGVTGKTSALVLPPQQGPLAWERPAFGEDIQAAQRRAPFCRQVMKERLPLDARDNALARAVFQERVILVPRPTVEPPSGAALAEALSLSSYACAPLLGRNKPLGVLVVDNPETKEEITADRLRFLELFANQAGAAMENSMLVHRLETAHQDLRETQERLIQGEKMAGLGEMAASVAHELRNPLVSIGGFAQRLNRITSSDSREHEYSGIIARETRRMEEMLANILEFSKKHLLCVTDCNVSTIIEEALALEADKLTRGSIRIKKQLTSHLPLIQGDEQKLRQVLINLISNARQVMPEGGTLTVRTHLSSLRGDRAVAVEVEDTGGGIPPEVMRNIFNPFFTTKDEGTGLGLSISHRIVEHHQGEIEVQNREAGALFILRLPVLGISHLSVDKKRRFG